MKGENKKQMEKVYFFEISGKLEAETEAEAMDLIHEMLSERTQFQINNLEAED
jgi:hypothetical protein